MPGVVMISHGLGAAAFFVVTLLLFFHKPTLDKAPWVIVACLVTGVWSLIASLYGANIIIDYQWVALSEVFQDGTWCLALIQMISSTSEQARPLSLRRSWLTTTLIISLVVLALNALMLQQQWLPGMTSSSIQFDFIGHLLLSILGLSLIEQLYRGVKPQRRWGIKFLCLSLGALFSYDFFMYAHGLLFNFLDPSVWSVRGAISLFIAPMILMSFYRNKRWHLDIAPSRILIYRSTVIVGCGVYLILIGALGYVIRHAGGDWGRALQIVFIFGAGLLLFSLLFSGNARAWLKVQMAKHVFKLYFDYRAEWLRFSKLMGERDSEFNLSTRIIMAFAGMVESPKGLLLIREKRAFVLKQQWNTNDFFEIDEPKLFDFVQQIEKPCLLTDLKSQSPETKEWFQKFRSFENAWLLIPLRVQDRQEALLILAQPRVRIDLNWEVRDLLSAAALQAAVFLVQEKLAEELTVAKQFESYHQLSAFMLHDIKNILNAIQLIRQNKKHAQNPKYIESIFITLESVHAKLSKLQNQLQQPDLPQCLDKINVVSVIKEVSDFYILKKMRIKVDQASQASKIFVRADSVQFRHCLMHLIDNAFEASHFEKTVTVSLKTRSGYVTICVIDQGSGMSHLFVSNELFKPFSSTKGSKGMGIGVFQVKSFIEHYGGTLKVRSQEGRGTEFIIELPEIQAIPKSDEMSSSLHSFESSECT